MSFGFKDVNRLGVIATTALCPRAPGSRGLRTDNGDGGAGVGGCAGPLVQPGHCVPAFRQCSVRWVNGLRGQRHPRRLQKPNSGPQEELHLRPTRAGGRAGGGG